MFCFLYFYNNIFFKKTKYKNSKFFIDFSKNKCYIKKQENIGVSPSGKASGSGPDTPGFES